MSTTVQEPAGVAQLHHGDTIHLAPHDVYRHGDNPWRVCCKEADVEVDWVLYRERPVVIVIWHIPARPAVCGSTAYDADDSVLRLEAAAA